ncbi:serine/threonine-protein kinase [Nocardia arizonensis]|uniref:serine/threonine-protein kinase n=1 Tax=Nocardia arizonensis TaxID=1141647 RepID=UPI000A8D0839|nr:serine/threonine-protein kinase [Nocardia arizonensis]
MQPLKSTDPKQIGPITIRGLLGYGGMGRVYFGVTDDAQPVAVKVIREDLLGREEVRARFFRELDALRSVQGPHIAALLDASDESADQPWIAIEYIRGLTLKEVVETRGCLSAEHAATLGLLLAKALADIHAADLLHRDLTPGNILMSREGPKVIDFGLAAFADGPSDLTGSTAHLGTPPCMSPEQVNSPRQISTASDVYSLGATLLYALTGHYPYRDQVTAARLLKISDPNSPPDLDGLPTRFEPLVQRMLAHEPADRPTVSEVRAWCEQFVGNHVIAAIRDLAVGSYVERDTDPEQSPPRKPAPKDLSTVAPPGSVIHRLAENLRREYAATARF